MKVFISHKKEDSMTALLIQRTFESCGTGSYLDLLDDSINSDGKALTDHLKSALNSCTDIIVVMSARTKDSWWVPFEIGMSAQLDMPTASYLTSTVTLPSYLSYWPRLKSTNDISTYVKIRERVKNQMLHESYALEHHAFTSRAKSETEEFYRQLKQELQR